MNKKIYLFTYEDVDQGWSENYYLRLSEEEYKHINWFLDKIDCLCDWELRPLANQKRGTKKKNILEIK